MERPIDFVITWVDGSDTAWQAEKNRYLAVEKGGSIDAGATRYRDWDNLKYWFRAVEKYAPWVNKVHFVTWGHVPQWLDPDAPKLHIVRHEDFIPREYLPTFSSHPIELNLHRIEGLSEQFVYFNDDFFLTAPVKPRDFFRKGLPCDSIAEEPIQFPAAELYNHIRINDIVFLNRHFDRAKARRQHPDKWFSLRAPHDCFKNLVMTLVRKPCFFGLNTQHLPQAYLKATYEEVWKLDPEQLHDTSTHRFRSETDVSQCVLKFYQMMQGNFVPYNKHKAGTVLHPQRELDEIRNVIQSRSRKFLCINDSDVTDLEYCKCRINDAFEKALPQRSAFEK